MTSRPSLPGQVFAVAAVLLAGGAFAAGLSGAEAAKARVEHMKALGSANKAIKEQLAGGSPDMGVIRLQAAKLAEGARDLSSWFPAGSGVEADPKSKALPAVWMDPKDFANKSNALVTAVAAFEAAAKSDDPAVVGGGFHEVGAACKGCHDTYKAKDPA